MMKILWRAICFILLSSKVLLGQQQITKNFSIADGLPNNSIRSLYIDSREFLWIGTENGVSVKRNTEFLNFFMEDGLAFNSCWAITEDKFGHMWLGSYGGGVSMFDGKAFHKIQDGLYTLFIRSIIEFEDVIWVGTTNGLNLINPQTLQVQKVENSQGDEELSFISGFFTKDNRLFFTTFRRGIFEVKKSKGSYRAEKVNSLEYIYALHQEGDKIFISGKEQLLVFSTESLISPKPKAIQVEESSNFYTFQQTSTKGLIGAATGLYSPNGGAYQISDEKIEFFNNRFNIDSRNLWSIAYHERSSTLYMGSLDKGMYEINLSDRLLVTESNGNEILGFEGENKLEVILRSDGVFYTEKGEVVSKHDFKQAQLRYFAQSLSWVPKHEDDFFELNRNLKEEELIFYGLHYQDNSYWVNSNLGIYQLSDKGQIIRYLPLHSLVIGFTPEGHLIESNPYGGMRIYPDLNQPKSYLYFDDNDPSTPDMLSQIVYNKERTYFSSVFAGLFRLDERGLFSFKESGTWDVEKIKSVFFTFGNHLIVGAEFGDVYLLEDGKKFKEIVKISKSDIFGNSIIGVLAYQEFILILTERGVNIYKDGVVKLIDDEQGLRKSIIKSYKIINDNLYLGYEDAYVTIHLPTMLKDTYKYYNLKITKLLIDFKPIPSETLNWFSFQPGSIVLEKFPSSLLIQVQPHRLLYPEKLQYRYRVNSSQDWTPYSLSNEIFLSSLNYGEYTLEVEVYDLHSGKTEFFSLVSIKVPAPFYLKTWFNLLTISIISIAVFILYQVRISQIKEREYIDRKVIETKMEALRSQMNPHFIFNAINSIQYYILKNENTKAIDFLGKFSHLIRKTLENSKASRINISKEIDYLKSYLTVENERMNNRLTWDITASKNVDLELDQIPPMLIQPLIENAIVHAFPSQIQHPSILVNFDKTREGEIICEIRDNGIGISTQQKKNHRSRGLELLVERISLIPNSQEDAVKIKSEIGKGTSIHIKVPAIN